MPFSAEEAKRILSIQGSTDETAVAARILDISADDLRSLNAEALENAHRVKSLLVQPDEAPPQLKENAEMASLRLDKAKETLLGIVNVFRENEAFDRMAQEQGRLFQQALRAQQQRKEAALTSGAEQARKVDNSAQTPTRKPVAPGYHGESWTSGYDEALAKLHADDRRRQEQSRKQQQLDRHDPSFTVKELQLVMDLYTPTFLETTPGPEYRAIIGCIAKHQRAGTEVARSEILEAIRNCSGQQGAQSYLAEILMDPSAHLSVKTQVSEMIRYLGTEYNRELQRLQPKPTSNSAEILKQLRILKQRYGATNAAGEMYREDKHDAVDAVITMLTTGKKSLEDNDVKRQLAVMHDVVNTRQMPRLGTFRMNPSDGSYRDVVRAGKTGFDNLPDSPEKATFVQLVEKAIAFVKELVKPRSTGRNIR